MHATHQRVHFQLLNALGEQLVRLGCQLDKVGWMEGEALVVCPRQLASKGQLIGYGIKVLQLLQLILRAPREYV